MVRPATDSGMDVEETIAAVRDAQATELDRLGSEKALIAATGASLEEGAVVRAAAARERALAATLAEWDDAADGTVSEAFGGAAGAASDRLDRLDAAPEGDDAFGDHLRTLQSVPERVGAGLVAAPLVLDRFYLQVVSFFVNEGDERGAELARDLRTDASDLDRARTGLAALDDAGREQARDAAVEAVGVAYSAYADALGELGLDPKPIC